MRSNKVADNDYILIQLPSSNLKLVHIKKNQKVSLGKFGTFNADDIIDKKYYLTYEINNGEAKVSKETIIEKKFIQEESNCNNVETIKNNKEIHQFADNQSLEYNEIERLKLESIKKGLNGEEIIETLLKNNKNYEKKTIFSKTKYLNQKKSKFIKKFKVLKIDTKTIVEYFQVVNPGKIRFIGVENVARILNLLAINPGKSYLVVDNSQGLLVSAIVDKFNQNHDGLIVGVHETKNNSYDVLRYYNFDSERKNILKTISWESILHNNTKEPTVETEEPTLNNNTKEPTIETEESTLNNIKESTIEIEDTEQAHKRIKLQKFQDKNNSNLEFLKEDSFDGLLIVAHTDNIGIIKKLYKYMKASSVLIVYSNSREVLLDLNDELHKEDIFINCEIIETFIRKYQVLSERTHPEMSGVFNGGYILYTYKYICLPKDQQD